MLLVSESERCIITPLHQKDIHHWSKVENESKKRIVLIIIAIIIAALLFCRYHKSVFPADAIHYYNVSVTDEEISFDKGRNGMFNIVINRTKHDVKNVYFIDNKNREEKLNLSL